MKNFHDELEYAFLHPSDDVLGIKNNVQMDAETKAAVEKWTDDHKKNYINAMFYANVMHFVMLKKIDEIVDWINGYEGKFGVLDITDDKNQGKGDVEL